jgi:hypothetical protein
MNVANLNNCKALFELSGWDDTSHVMRHGYNFGNEQHMFLAHKNEKYMPGIDLPAFDSGFLLRKLRENGKYPHLNIEAGLYGKWQAKYAYKTDKTTLTYPGIAHGVADTPEDALILLAIQLFKDGILQKESTEL